MRQIDFQSCLVLECHKKTESKVKIQWLDVDGPHPNEIRDVVDLALERGKALFDLYDFGFAGSFLKLKTNDMTKNTFPGIRHSNPGQKDRRRHSKND